MKRYLSSGASSVALVSALACTPPLFAQADASLAERPESQAQSLDHTSPAELGASSDEWRISFAPFLWLPGIDGSSTAGGVTTDISVTFLDILDNADTVLGLMGNFELTKGRLSLLISPSWLYMESSGSGRPAPDVKVDAKLTTMMAYLEFGAAWRLFEGTIDDEVGQDPAHVRRWSFDGIVGGRATFMDLELNLDVAATVTLPSGRTPREVEREHNRRGDEVWVDPLIGARFSYDIAQRVTILLRGDIGGFGVGSDFAWQGFGAIGWRFDFLGHPAAAFAGYRAIGQDYENDGFAWDAIVHGPVLGMQINF